MVTEGNGPDVTGTVLSSFTSTDSPNALPVTSVTSASAELANAVEHRIAEKQATDR